MEEQAPKKKSALEVLKEYKEAGIGGILAILLASGMLASGSDLDEVKKAVDEQRREIVILQASQQSLVKDLDRILDANKKVEDGVERLKELLYHKKE